MSNLGPQQQNVSYDGILQIPGGVTAQLQQVQDGEGRATGLFLSSSGTNATTADSFTASTNGTAIPNVVPRLISDGFGDYVSVKDFGVIGDGISDDTAAINAAINSGYSLYFPAGTYLISSTITGGTGAWIGAGSGGWFDNNPSNSATIIKLSGTNSGNAFVKPPTVFIGFHIDGQTTDNVGVQLGQNGSFTAGQKWKNITVRNCDVGIDCYNFFVVSFDSITVQGNNKGIRIDPTDNPALDDGYFTSTLWQNIYIADNTIYGLHVNVPNGSKTWEWDNVVIERNGSSGSYQVFLRNVSLHAIGLYCEGSAAIPALQTYACVISLVNGYFNGTYGIDATSNNITLTLSQCAFTTANDILRNFPATATININSCTLLQDVSGLGANVIAFNQYNGSSTIQNNQRLLSIGSPSINGRVPSNIIGSWAYTTTVNTTVGANSSTRVIFNAYHYGLYQGGNTIGCASVNGYYPGLVTQTTCADTGSPHYFCVFLVNTTSSPITLANAEVDVLFTKTQATSV